MAQSLAAKGKKCFEQALDIARAQPAKSWECGAAIEQERLWRDQGKQDAARELSSGPRLVHRRLRYTRSEGSEGVALDELNAWKTISKHRVLSHWRSDLRQ